MSEKTTDPDSGATLPNAPSNHGGEDVESAETMTDQSQKEKEEGAVIGERDIRGFKWVMAVFAILSSTFLFALDTTVVADIQPHIISSVGEFEKFPWLGAAFVLPAATLVLPWSKAYSLFNVKWLYFANVTLFEIGSAISGAAPTMNALIVGRTIAGVGGCGMYLGGMTFLSVTTRPKERPIYVSLVTPVWGLGTVLGPIVGGAFAESSVGWRWGFYINLFIYAVVAPSMVFVLPSLNFAPGLTTGQKLAKFDWLGLIIFLGWGISFIMALQFGGTVYAWSSASEIVLWVFTGVLAVAFVLSHIFHPFIDAENRYYPAHMLKNLKLGVLQLAIFCAPGCVYVPIYYIPLYFQFARGEGAVDAAVRLLPFVFMIVTVAIVNGVLMSKLGYITPWFLAGGLLAIVGSALMFTVNPETSNSAIYGYSVILGIGGGCFLMSGFGCVAAVVDVADIFNAIGVLSVAQGLGIVFFVSAAGIIFQNLGVNYVRPLLPADFTGSVNDILAGSSSAIYQTFSGEVRKGINEAIVKAMSRTYTLSIAAACLTALTAPLLGRTKVA